MEFVEGRIPFKVPSVSEECFTYYKVFGDLASTDQTPLICLHGGPGAGHEYMLTFAKLWSMRKTPVIFYDQIGCASSTHLRETKGNEDLWQPGLFLDELRNVIQHFKLERYDLLGHSWGGAVAAALAVTKPPALQRLILFSPLGDAPSMSQRYVKPVDELPSQLRDAVVKHDEGQKYEMKDYQAAGREFFKRYAYRDEPFPGEDMARAFANFAADNTVGGTMIGREFRICRGSLRDYTLVPVMGDIDVPVLLINGEFDYVDVKIWEDGLKKVKYVNITGASHMCFLEAAGREKVLDLICEFRNEHSTV